MVILSLAARSECIRRVIFGVVAQVCTPIELTKNAQRGIEGGLSAKKKARKSCFPSRET